MRPIRVGFLSPSLQLGGAERWIVSLATGLNPTYFDALAIAIQAPNAVHPIVATHLHDRIPILHGTKHFAELASRSDAIIAWGECDLSAAAVYTCKIVYVAQGQCPWTCACVRKAIERATHLVAVSKAAAQTFPDPTKVAILYNAVDTNRCAVHTPRNVQRALWQVQPHEKLIGYVGRPSDEKTPLACVYAAKALGPPYRPLLCGGGPYADPYHAMARRICPDVVNQPEVDQVGDVYAALDCMILASRVEGHSLALAEAWYCRCPTIATPVGATPELEAKHGKLTVTLPTAHTARDLVTAVLAVLHPGNDCIERAHEVVANNYTTRHMCRRWEAYLAEICRPGSPEAAHLAFAE